MTEAGVGRSHDLRRGGGLLARRAAVGLAAGVIRDDVLDLRAQRLAG